MRGTFQWNKTEVNATAVTNCFYGPDGVVATRQCVFSNTWATPFVDQCETIGFDSFKQVNSVLNFSQYLTHDYLLILQVNISAENVNQVISNITDIISTANETSDQSSDNLRVISDVLMQSVDIILTQNVSLEVANQVNNVPVSSIHHNPSCFRLQQILLIY